MALTIAGVKRFLELGLESGEGNIFVSLHTGAPGSNGANEKSGDGYSRVQVPDGGWQFPSVSVSNVYSVSNRGQLNFADATGDYSVSIKHAGFWSASTGGTFYGSFALTANASPRRGARIFFPSGNLRFQVTTAD